MSDIVITHHPTRHCFEAVVEDLPCTCAYLIEGRTMVFTSTRVPSALGGRGIAAALVQSALVWAREQGYRVRPDCSYVHRYIEQHKATQDLLVENYRL